MSHVYHLLFGEGEKGVWWDSYEIAVFAEIVILRGLTTVLLRKRPAVWFSALGLALAVILPFGGGGRVYDALALSLDVMLLVTLWFGITGRPSTSTSSAGMSST